MKAYQIKPATCEDALTFSECRAVQWTNSQVAEEKWDGLRYLLQIRPNGAAHNFLTSRRVSVETGRFVEKQDKIPSIKNWKAPKELSEFILDGEIFSSGFSSDTQHDMLHGNFTYKVFDLIQINSGVSIAGFSAQERRARLEALFKRFELPSWMELTPQSDNILELLDDVQKRDGEGIVVKDLSAPYGKGWFKVKKEADFDGIICGFVNSDCKTYGHKGWIATFEISEWREKPPADKKDLIAKKDIRGKQMFLCKFGKASGIDFALREKMSTRPQDYLGKVVEVTAIERIKKSGKLRSPRYSRMRPDKNPDDCVWIQK